MSLSWLVDYVNDHDANDWLEIRRIGNSKLVQFTILIPVLGYLIIFSEWFIKDIIGSSSGFYHMWKIYTLYYGLSFIAFGSLIYNIYCPKIYRNYGSLAEYINNEERLYNKSNMTRVILATINIIRKYKTFLPLDAGSNVRSFYPNYINIEINDQRKRSITNKATEVVDTGQIVEYLAAYYLVHSDVNTKQRLIVLILYGIGFILVAIPSLAMFIEVIIKTFSKIIF